MVKDRIHLYNGGIGCSILPSAIFHQHINDQSCERQIQSVLSILKVRATPFKDVDSFTYLGSVMDSQRGDENDIKSRIRGKSRT